MKYQSILLVALLSVAIVTSSFVSSAASAAPNMNVYTTTQVVMGLRHHPAKWVGKTVLVRGRFIAYPGAWCSLGQRCPFRGGLSDTGEYINLLNLQVTPATKKLLTLKPATYRVRLLWVRVAALILPEAVLLARVR